MPLFFIQRCLDKAGKGRSPADTLVVTSVRGPSSNLSLSFFGLCFPTTDSPLETSFLIRTKMTFWLHLFLQILYLRWISEERKGQDDLTTYIHLHISSWSTWCRNKAQLSSSLNGFPNISGRKWFCMPRGRKDTQDRFWRDSLLCTLAKST